ncbi:Cobalt/zinc/cadmium efflux RND transporter, membrane fusion protein, CzcB family [hydrothermal vent metagenome]|uniref:Cobalt/zinc/cadmium efflux RND transporter, membrane fusion protein, CzcB family n=1 Tax=hydrothermal vent metagenome TaxID=652676 RepID=A0A3B1BKY5_9ZZZZ
MKVRKTRVLIIAAFLFLGIALLQLAACDSVNKNGQGDGATEAKKDEKHDEHAHEGEERDEQTHEGEERDEQTHEGEERDEQTHEGEEHDEQTHEGEGAGHEGGVRLTDGELKEFDIGLAVAGPGELNVYVTLPGEVSVNQDMMAHIVPRVSGVVREVYKSLGDNVKRGEVIAVIESRELSDVKAEYLATHERISLAQANYTREARLWKEKVSSEQDYLNAKKELAEEKIALRSAEQKLHALGYSEKYLKKLLGRHNVTFTRYEIIAPFSGTVIKKHITLGEALQADSGMFVIADLSTVWVNLSIYQKDLPFVRKGASVLIIAGHGIPEYSGVISYIRPIVGEQTRTALARAVLSNEKGELRPGLFVTGKVNVKSLSVPILVPKTALQTYEGKTIVFIKTDEGFKPSEVTIGRSSDTSVELTSGLLENQEYVTKGAFTLKAELSKGEFESGHSH